MSAAFESSAPVRHHARKSEQIAHTLRTLIQGGTLSPGEQLPAERILGERFATTRITVKEALQRLEAEGLIYRAERRGWFISPQRLTYDPARHLHFHHWIDSTARRAHTRLLAVEPLLAGAGECQWLGIAPLTPLVEIRRLRAIDGRPVLHVTHQLVAARFVGIEHEDLEGSLTELYARHFGITQGSAALEIEATAARGEVARSLNLAEGSQVLRIRRRNLDPEGRLVDGDIEHWRPDAIRICLETGMLAAGHPLAPPDNLTAAVSNPG
ncbi:UTRA domain-containing protein [Aeromonas schubertii]